MVDIHTHILPAVDDGADSLDEALEMIEIAAGNGTDSIVLTPHHLTHDMRSQRLSKQHLLDEFNKFKELANDRFPNINLYFGAENYIGQDFPPADMLIPLNGTRYVLIEFDFQCQFSTAMFAVSALCKAGLKPIIAHPERYEFVKSHPFSVNELIEEGALLQLNCSSLYRTHDGVYEAAMFLLNNGLYALAASDGHSAFFRTPDMSEGYAFVSSQFSAEIADSMFAKNPAAIINGKNL